VSGQRRYNESVLRRLSVVDVAQRAGLSLDEIRELVHHGNDPMSGRLRALAEQRLPEIDSGAHDPAPAECDRRVSLLARIAIAPWSPRRPPAGLLLLVEAVGLIDGVRSDRARR
jgi:DNA-binding transcriptional MerR regulator